MSDESLRIECPGCHRKFRLKSRPNSAASAVKCPKCSAKIPLPEQSQPAQPDAPTPQQAVPVSQPEAPPKTSDADLRRMLRRAKARSNDEPADPDQTDQMLNIPEDTQPSAPPVRPEEGASTMPIGQLAMRAEDLGTAGPPKGRPRVDTPRAGSQHPRPTEREKPAARTIEKRRSQPQPGAPAIPGATPNRAPTPPPGLSQPAVDEPTFTGPVPGRAPKITPTDDDLSRFLQPGNYLVRVEDVVYAPVSEEVLAKIIDGGIIVAIDEIAPDGGQWHEIAAGDLLAEVKARLAHRAHHVLSRVCEGRPASEFGRPTPPEEDAPVRDAAAPPATQPEITDGESAVATTNDATQPARKGSLLAKFMIVFALLGVAATATAITRPHLVNRVRDWIAPPPPPPPAPVIVQAPADKDAGVDMGPPDPTPAFQSALATVASAHAVADSIDGLLKGAKEDGNETAVTTLSWMKWLREPTGVDGEDLIDRLMKRGDWKQARQVANWLIATRGETPELHDLVHETLKRQFDEETKVEITTDMFRRVVEIDPGHRPALVLEDKTGQRWRAWPDLGEDGWRGDIATYRLCQVMVCHFNIPETRAMQIHRKTWRELQKASEKPVADMMKRLRSDFDWNRRGFLKGSLRRLPAGAAWPVEATNVWRPWLTAGDTLSKLDGDVVEAHHGVAFFGADKVYPELQDVTARQLARQISTMLLVDYLVGNWNRFAATKDEWGSRTWVNDGLVQSVDDSAAFLGTGSRRVNARFSWTSRFSRAAVESLERLDPEEVDPLLFPDASKNEKEKLEELWSQRRQALRRINKLIKKYGAEDVYDLDAKVPKHNGQR